MNFTEQQNKIFQAGTGSHLRIIAGAGAGKTTSLVELQKLDKKRGLYCPFNKSIAEDAKRKFLGTNCLVSTLHAFAYRAVMEPGQRVHDGGSADVRASGVLNRVSFPRMAGWGDFRFAAVVNRAVSKFCVSADERITRDHAVEALIESVGDPDMITNEITKDRAQAAIAALAEPVTQAADLYFRHLVTGNKLTFDVYLKLFEMSPSLIRQAFAGFHHVYKDEAQDNNPVETSILIKSGLPIISVGDPYQQIYSWRGAQNALDQLPGETMFLTESFRFGPKIAEQAMEVLRALPRNAPDYDIIGAGDDQGRGTPRNAILCRTNTGVIEAALKASKTNVPFYVDNARQLMRNIEDAQSLHDGRPGKGTFSPYVSWDEAVSEAEAGNAEISRLVKIVEEGRVAEVSRVIRKSSDTETGAELTIMTSHRSKGREFPFVKLWNDFQSLSEMTARFNKVKGKSQAEATLALENFNVLYVAVTRAEKQVYGLESLLDLTKDSPTP